MQLKYLKNIQTPKDIRDYNIEQLRELCDEIRNYTIDTVTAVGGHLAPTLGAIELTVALHYVFNTPKDKLIWDVGHQAYAHKILTGRFGSMNTIRQFGGLSGFLKRTESEYDVFGAGHASTSISAALGVAAARDQNNQDFKVSAIIGDGSLTGGLAYEGLNNSGILNTQILVVLNDNEMSISPNVGAMSKYLTRITTNPLYNKIRNEIWNITDSLPWGKKLSKKILQKIDESLKALLVPGVLFDELGFRYFGPIDGHDVNELVKTLNNIKNINQPVLLHIITKKGKGLVSTSEKNGEYHRDAVKYHAVKPSQNNGELKKSNETKTPSFQDVFGFLSCEVARNRKDTICITAAMREGTGLVPYAKEFPDRYYDVGIAEGHGVTFSAGFATEGLRPIVAIYSTFLQRAFDHIVHDVAIQHLPVIFCMDRSGIAGEDGPTHHGSLDIPYLRCIQDMIVSAPRNGNEFRHLLYSALNQKESPFSIRYPKSSAVEFDSDGQAELLPIGSWEVLRTGSDVVVLSVGPLCYNVERAAEVLHNNDISVEIVNCRFIKPMDESYLKSLIERFENVVTIEEGVVIGGFGDGVSSWLLENGFQGQIKRLGLPDSFVQHGKREELLSEVRLDENSIIKTIQSLVNTSTDIFVES
ncbi:MAG: 1-deoxy-D-xylulose-5-phosphate synthase [Candidatus Neomarinimicrobiota bacterium]|nr:1-deoxy-D-xylulose-5-phosphate synthase [Candidatus Neomarinimicrobiota bacterium]